MRKICKNCGADNSETEQRCLVCKAWLPSLTERVLRKPKGPKFSSSGRRPGLRNYDENVISWPERTDDAEAIWTGERREIGVRNIEELVADQLDLALRQPRYNGFSTALSVLIGLAHKRDLFCSEAIDNVIGDC